MKKLLALMLCAVAGSAMAQTSLSTWNDQTSTAAGVKVRNVPLGSGAPSNDDTVKFTAATSLGNGLYQAPGYLPYYPTAAALWPRVVQVSCTADGVCDGYTITPSIGRGEYVYIQPIIKK
jgi:hypothetical protein